MGIPLYFKSIYEDYPEIIINHIDGMNNLFLDLNCAIHPCCQNILKNYNDNTINKNILEKKMINETINYMQLLIKTTNPHLIYIAIDGVAPCAKMNQQRLRRYKTILDKKMENDIKTDLNMPLEGNHWDKNAISPGTTFMNKLTEKINSFISEYSKVNSNVKVIFSSSYMPGEGEHKILQFIKANEIQGNTIIYGLDADLIMLAMASKCNNIYLLREAIEFGQKVDNKLLYLDINLLKSKLITTLKIKLHDKEQGLYLNNTDSLRMIDDYIFLCFLLGNDFLPHNLSIDLRHNGHDILLDSYLDNYIISKEFLVDAKKLKINNRFLYAIFKIMCANEDNILIKIQNKRNKFRMFNNKCENEFERRMNIISNSPIVNNTEERKVCFSKKYWRTRYYKQCLNIEDNEEIDELCHNYLEGLKWTFLYYFDSCPSWEWKYEYLHPPTLKDLTNFLLENDINKIKLQRGKPCHPIVQLLSILPSQSNDLLPYNYRKLMNVKSSIGMYYPKSYVLDTFLKRYHWMCPPVLPNINIKNINNAFRKISMDKETKLMFNNNSKIIVFNLP